MPSKSRKKIKGQARKAKAKAAGEAGFNIRYTSADKCHHDGLISNTTSEGLVESFIISLFKPFLSEDRGGYCMSARKWSHAKLFYFGD